MCVSVYESVWVCVCVCIGESVREWIGGRASRSMHIIKLWTAVQNIRNGFLVILYFHRCCLYRCICVIFAPRSLSECVRTCRFVVRCVYTYAGRALLCFHNQISMWECENVRMMNWEFYELLSSNYWCAHVWERKRVRERKTIGRDSQ